MLTSGGVQSPTANRPSPRTCEYFFIHFNNLWDAWRNKARSWPVVEKGTEKAIPFHEGSSDGPAWSWQFKGRKTSSLRGAVAVLLIYFINKHTVHFAINETELQRKENAALLTAVPLSAGR